MKFKKSNEVICPICGEPAQIKLKNSKISIHECRYNHTIDDLNIDEFETSQLINETKIICGTCKHANKGNTYKNDFFICNTCHLNLCPLCKMKHDKTHETINYDNKYLYVVYIMKYIVYIVKLARKIYAHYVSKIMKIMISLDWGN